MSTTPMSAGAGAEASGLSTVPLRLEVIKLPVADFDRAKAFYQRLGWRFDIEFKPDGQHRALQFTPPGSPASIQFAPAGPAPLQRLLLIVDDIEAARAELTDRGVEVSEIDAPPWGRFAYFDDPDGNGWVLQLNSRL
jgi:predicted enzyme related to lactoylglutathione lyase